MRRAGRSIAFAVDDLLQWTCDTHALSFIAGPGVIVLDASALLELLLGTDAGRTLAERVLAPEETLHVPHLADVCFAPLDRLDDLR
jgi:hypothetical protein